MACIPIPPSLEAGEHTRARVGAEEAGTETGAEADTVHSVESVVVTTSEDGSVGLWLYRPPSASSGSGSGERDMKRQHCDLHKAELTSVGMLREHPDIIRASAVVPLSDPTLPAASQWLLFTAGGREFLQCHRLSLSGSAPSQHGGIGVQVAGLGGLYLGRTQARRPPRGGHKYDLQPTLPSAGTGSRSTDHAQALNALSLPTPGVEEEEQHEIRTMSICAFPGPNKHVPGQSGVESQPHRGAQEWCVVSGNSSGRLRVILFDSDPVLSSSLTSSHSRFLPLGSSDCHGCPILSVATLALPLTVTEGSESSSRRLVVSGDTGGKIAIWDFEELLQARVEEEKEGARSFAPLAQTQAHQFGVNCLQIVALPESVHDTETEDSAGKHGSFLILSGGDDGALITSKWHLSLSSDMKSSCELTGSFNQPEAHLSAIKGLWVSAEATTVFSSGYDQRLKTWEIQADPTEAEVRVELRSECALELADVACLAVGGKSKHSHSSHRVMIGGQGMQVVATE